MAAGAAPAQWSVSVDEEVAELTGSAVGAAEQSAVADNRPADPRRKRQVHIVATATRRSECSLGEDGDLRVPVEHHGQAERGRDPSGQGNVAELGSHVRRVDDDAGIGIDRTRGGDCHGRQGTVTRGRRL